MGRQSTSSAIATALPAGGMLGLFDDTRRSGPRYGVAHVRVSMVLRPQAMRFAHGCFTDNALTV